MSERAHPQAVLGCVVGGVCRQNGRSPPNETSLHRGWPFFAPLVACHDHFSPVRHCTSLATSILLVHRPIAKIAEGSV